MQINVERVISRLDEIYECGLQEDGTYSRVAYSMQDKKGRETFKGYFEKLGLVTRQDPAGNLIARMEGKKDLPAIVTGSHLDTVIEGGKYDGALGCVAGLEVMETLVENNCIPDHPLEIVVFADEEGIRFGNGMFGSSAFCGLPLDIFRGEDKDVNGRTREEILNSFGVVLENAKEAGRASREIEAVLELHIEQGGILYSSKTPLGIVTSIAGVKRYEVVVEGEANHSGSTQMCHRKDALAAASEFIAQVPQIVEKYGNEFTVSTVGSIQAEPGAVNVIPGRCTFLLEIRDQEEELMLTLEKVFRSRLEEICSKKGMNCSLHMISSHTPEKMNPGIRGVIHEVCEERELEFMEIPSGAFHDSLLLTRKYPTGMIFVPSIHGISHSPKEESGRDEIRLGCQVLLETILKLDKKEGAAGEPI